MPRWTSRIYYCKNCKRTVEIVKNDSYICSTCNKSLISTTGSAGYNLGFNFMARTTKMEFSEQTYEDNMKEFRRNKK